MSLDFQGRQLYKMSLEGRDKREEDWLYPDCLENNYVCLGHLSAGQAELGSDEQQVQYTFICNGPITGYQVQSQIPVTGVQSPPTVTDLGLKPLNDSFSCSGLVM